jgi:hypothetical protein
MARELLRGTRRAGAREVGGAGAQRPRGEGQAAGHQRGLAHGADADGHIETLTHQVHGTVGEDQFHGDERVKLEEVLDERADHPGAEVHARGHAQPPAGRGLETTDGGLGLGDAGEHLGAVLVEGRAGLGEAQLLRGALQQPHPQALLELGQLAADGGLGQPQCPRRRAQALVLGHLQEEGHLVEIRSGHGVQGAGVGPASQDGREFRGSVAHAFEEHPDEGRDRAGCGDTLDLIGRTEGPFERFLPKLAENGIIAADNMIEPVAARADAERYRAAVRAHPELQTVLLPIGQGIELSCLWRKGVG